MNIDLTILSGLWYARFDGGEWVPCPFTWSFNFDQVADEISKRNPDAFILEIRSS